jgi:hypothetical protein
MPKQGNVYGGFILFPLLHFGQKCFDFVENMNILPKITKIIFLQLGIDK